MSLDAVVRIDLDQQTGACYVSLSTSTVDRTVELTESVLLDLDKFGVVVGIETLFMTTPVPFDRLMSDFDVHSSVIDVLETVRPDPASFVLQATSRSAGSARASELSSWVNGRCRAG